MISYKKSLKDKLSTSSANIGVIGLGYVGLPLALAFCETGFPVTGFDIDDTKCKFINEGKSYIEHIAASRYKSFVKDGRLRATNTFKHLNDMDAILICVPTPLDEYRVPDLSYIRQTVKSIVNYVREGQLVVLESSTYPGTTKEILANSFSDVGLQDGKDIFVAFSPEREDPSNPNFTTRSIPKVVGADNPDSRFLACQLYKTIVDNIVPVSSAATAEATKLTENIFRATNIALVNELKLIYDEMDIDIWEVIDAASTKPFGYMPFYPGPGLGGHCIPVDPFYLTWKARQYGMTSRFIELAGEINTAMPHHVVDKLSKALSDTQGASLKGAKILLVGIAYKPNVDDDRESPAYKIMDILMKRHATVDYYDPHVAKIEKTRKYPQFEGLRSIELNAKSLKNYNAVIVVTAHQNVDYKLIADYGRLVIDTRNVMAEFPNSNTVKA